MELGHLLWVYGSLMSAESALATLAPRTVLPGTEPLTVTGWRRSWNCLSAKTFLGNQGTRLRRVVLGLEWDPDATTEGVLLQLGPRDMALIRRREQAYDEVDITAHVERPPGRVVTFVAKADRLRWSAPSDVPLVIEREYFETCCRGAREHGLVQARRELEATVDLELVTAAGAVEYLPLP